MNVRRVSSRVYSVILPVTLFVLLSLLLAACQPIQRPAPDAAPAEEVAALPAAIPFEWDGTLEVTGITMRFLVSLAQGADGWSGLIDVPQQGMSDLPLHHVTIAPPAFHFEMLEGESAATFDGTLAADGTVSGEFVQGPYAGTFQMAPLVAEPVVEKPYLEEEVTVLSGEHTLAGTLSMPAGDGPFPALILVSGSGPQNRNEEIPAVTGYAPFAEIADRLTREGFAVLRYDDRGVGASTGDFASATTADFADDAHAALAYLRTRAEVNPAQLGIAGHSEGSIIAGMVAAADPDLAFVVSIAGPGVRGETLIVEQVASIAAASGYDEEMVAEARAQQEKTLELMLAGDWEGLESYLTELITDSYDELTPEQQEAMGPLEELVPQRVAAEMEGLRGAWFTFFLTYDPTTDWQQVTVPTLLIFGELDTQVPAGQNLAPLQAALAENPNVTSEVLAGANHLFQAAKTGAPQEYTVLPGHLMPELLDLIAAWLGEQIAP